MKNYLQLQKERLKKISGLYRIQTLDLCDTSAVLYQYKASKPAGSRSLNWFNINQWKDDDEIMNVWKSYMWTCGVKNYIYCVTIVIVIFSHLKMFLHKHSPGVWLVFNRDAIIYGASCFTSGLPMVMEVLSEGVLQPKLTDEEVEKATNKSNIIYSKHILFWLT